MSWIRGRISAVVLMCVLATAGCWGDSKGADPKSSLPQGPQTLQQASDSMRNLKSVAFTISTEGEPAFPIKSGEVRLLRNGDAQGKLVVQMGVTLETDFVLLGDDLYYKGLTGGYQKTDKERILSVYDPSAVLDPERGIAKLLAAARSAQPEAREKVGGEDAYRVKVTLPKQEAEGVIPGIEQDLAGQVWIAADDHRLLKVRGVLPPASGGDGEQGAVVITFTEFDADYQIKAPI